VQHAGVCATGNDGRVGRGLTTLAAKLVQELGLDLVFEFAGCRELHRTPMGGTGDLCGFPHQRDFVAVFDQTHLVERGTHIVNERRRTLAGTRLRTHCVQRRRHARIPCGIVAEGIPKRRLVGEQLGKLAVEFLDRVRGIETKRLFRAIGTVAKAIPDFLLDILVAAKQDGLRRAARHQDQNCFRFGKAGQVVEVAVGAIGKGGIPIAHALGRGGDDGHTTARSLHLLKQ